MPPLELPQPECRPNGSCSRWFSSKCWQQDVGSGVRGSCRRHVVRHIQNHFREILAGEHRMVLAVGPGPRAGGNPYEGRCSLAHEEGPRLVISTFTKQSIDHTYVPPFSFNIILTLVLVFFSPASQLRACRFKATVNQSFSHRIRYGGWAAELLYSL